jgi:molybdate transport system substrate-binding protein
MARSAARSWLATLSILGAAIAAPPVLGDTAQLKVLTAGAFRGVLTAAAPSLEAAAHAKLQVQGDTAGGLVKRIEGGERFDAVILTMGGLAKLAGEGKIEEAGVRPVAKVGIGIAVKVGSKIAPPRTVDQFKAMLLAARSITYIDPASGGSSGIYLDGLFKRLGIAEELRAKSVLVRGGISAEKVASGEAEIAMQQMSEIVGVPGVVLAGPLPEEIQSFTTYGIGVSSSAASQEAARAFSRALAAPAISELVRSKGMEPAE